MKYFNKLTKDICLLWPSLTAGYYECQADNIYAIDRRGFRTDYAMVNF